MHVAIGIGELVQWHIQFWGFLRTPLTRELPHFRLLSAKRQSDKQYLSRTTTRDPRPIADSACTTINFHDHNKHIMIMEGCMGINLILL
jgi:hypothetical protein